MYHYFSHFSQVMYNVPKSKIKTTNLCLSLEISTISPPSLPMVIYSFFYHSSSYTNCHCIPIFHELLSINKFTSSIFRGDFFIVLRRIKLKMDICFEDFTPCQSQTDRDTLELEFGNEYCEVF